MTKRVKMTVEMGVTIPQGIALQAMFKHWNRLASWGSSRMVAFYVDGDGDFKPKCSVTFAEEMPELTEELEKAACVCEDASPDAGRQYQFDFDPIAWKLRDGETVPAKVVVSEAAMDQIEKAIESPAQPNEALRRAMSKFRVVCDEQDNEQGEEQ